MARNPALSIQLFFVMMTIHLFRVMPMSIHLFSLMLILLIYPFLVMELGTDGDSVP